VTDALVWLGPLSAVSFAGIGLLVGWAVWAPEALRFPPPPEPTPEPPPPEPEPLPPPGLEYAAPGFRKRYAGRCRQLGVEVTAEALADFGVLPYDALRLARQSPATDLAERVALDLAQAGWTEGARDLAAAVRASSPLPPAVTERLLDLGRRHVFTPTPEAP
jgi:hypothetical protein